MRPVASIFGVVPGVSGGARADLAGQVQEVVGQIEAESVCAVVAMSTASLDRATSVLGLGTLRGWSTTGAKVSLYVRVESSRGFVVFAGAASKSLEAMSRKIAQAVIERRDA